MYEMIMRVDEEGYGLGFEKEAVALEWIVVEKGDRSRVYHHPVVAHYKGARIVVDPGFYTDGLSKPRPTWALVGHPFGDALPAAIIHDGLYALQEIDRKTADQCFRDLMKVLPVNPVRRNLMYAAVRSGGWLPWQNKTEEEKENAKRFVTVKYDYA